MPCFLLRRETVEKECTIFAMGIDEYGQYEILGFYINPVENHIAYRNVKCLSHLWTNCEINYDPCCSTSNKWQ
ncbi:hypothetical protein [Thermoplasma acidophilum]|uniref:Uncharacterized protein n=1 Tax=Thermoplasma acidophilum (strain ATCC 25905 / DSM 1728 / JCM 9062 / NBRC 15155 / AMRC-C165) TaxID=273075 RepID=Q9HLN8_THEAC|nr:hypothetical protein [Thermoplasma acidophilum]